MQTALPLSPRQLLIEVLMDLNEAEMHSRVLTSHKRHTYTPTHTTVSSPYKHNANDVFYMNTQTLKYSCSVYNCIIYIVYHPNPNPNPRKKIIHHSGDFSSALQKASRVQQVQAGV